MRSSKYVTLEEIIGNPKKQIKGMYPCSPLTWWKGVALGRFPRPIVLSPTNFVWNYDEVSRLAEMEFNYPGSSWDAIYEKVEKANER